LPLRSLHVAHLNHQLRGADSDGDAEFVAEQAVAWQVPITVESADVAGRARQENISIELAARRCRYEFFERLCLQLGSSHVVLAHHADDHVETVLHRFIRGTGLRGLGGIRAVRPIRHGSEIMIVRPLLTIWRVEIERYAAEHDVAFRTDASNRSSAYTRNRLRNELLPLLREQFNPKINEAICRLAEQARAADSYLHEVTGQWLESMMIEHRDRRITLDARPIVGQSRAQQMQLIREIIIRLGASEREISFVHLCAVADLLTDCAGSKQLHLPGGLHVSRQYERLIFELVTQSADSYLASPREYRVAVPGITRLPEFGMELEVEIMQVNVAVIDAYLQQRQQAGRQQCCDEEWIDADQLDGPMIARAPRLGDSFSPLGMSNTKKLSDFFIDEKIDAHRRKQIIVVCDSLGPVWVAPYRIDHRVRLMQQSRRVCRLKIRSLDS